MEWPEVAAGVLEVIDNDMRDADFEGSVPRINAAIVGLLGLALVTGYPPEYANLIDKLELVADGEWGEVAEQVLAELRKFV